MSETKVKTGKVRFSYANVFEPSSMGDGPEKYSISLIIPKNDKKTIKKIKAAIGAALEEGKSSKFGGKIPAKSTLKIPLRDGDEERPDDEPYEDSMFVNANNTRKPQIVDEDLEEIMSQDEFYSGCFGRATISFYCFNTNGNKGVACSLGNIQKLEDGDRLTAGFSSAADDFGDDDEDDLM